jgi:hypothetical protein
MSVLLLFASLALLALDGGVDGGLPGASMPSAASDASGDSSASAAPPPPPGRSADQARSISHWSPYDHVGVVNADP